MIYTLTLNPSLDRQYTVKEINHNEVLRADDCRTDLGGKGINVSRALKQLNIPSVVVGFVGGLIGKRLVEGLVELNIHTEFIQIADETRINTSITGSNQDDYIKVNEPGPAIQPGEMEQLVDKILKLAAPDDWWVLSGSLPGAVPVTIYADLVRDIQSIGAHVCLDSSGEPLRYGFTSNPRMMKPNLAEFSELINTPLNNKEGALSALTTLDQVSSSLFLLSMGMHGVLLKHDGIIYSAKAPSIRVANPIGAGDALLAGFLAALTGGEDLLQSLRWAVAGGSVAAGMPGTSFGSRKDLEKIIPLIQTKVLYSN